LTSIIGKKISGATIADLKQAYYENKSIEKIIKIIAN